MSSIVKLLALPGSDRRLLIEAGIVLAVLRLALGLLHLHRVRAIADSTARFRRRHEPVDRSFATRAVWAVRTVSPHVPGATCLSQALALHYLLRRRGYAPALRIGIARHENGFEGHAWVEDAGETLLGGEFSADFLVPMQGGHGG